MDSTIVKVHPDGTGALKKRSTGHRQIPRGLDNQASFGCRGCPNGGDVLTVPRQAHDAPEGRRLLRRLGNRQRKLPLLMDRAYEGNETRHLH